MGCTSMQCVTGSLAQMLSSHACTDTLDACVTGGLAQMLTLHAYVNTIRGWR